MLQYIVKAILCTAKSEINAIVLRLSNCVALTIFCAKL